MFASQLRFAVSVLALGALVLSAIIPDARAEAPSVEPEATRLLKRMTDHLGGLQRFSMVTENMFDDVLPSGQKIQRDFTSHIVIQRPDKLRAEQQGDLVDQVLLYDGKTLTIHNRTQGYYAVADAPADIDGLLDFARDTLDIVPPSGDLVFSNAFELLTAAITSGLVVGKSEVGGVLCDQLAFRSPGVDWQVWIADGKDPLPMKYVLSTQNDPAQPQFITLISDWNVKPKTNDATFRFSAPKDAKKIDFIRIDAGQTSGR